MVQPEFWSGVKVAVMDWFSRYMLSWELSNTSCIAGLLGPSKVERARKASPTGGNSRIAGHGTKFGRRKELAIAALLSERNIAEAARVAGIGTPTMYRWIGEPEFQAG